MATPMHAQALSIPWCLPPAFHVVAPFRCVSLADLPGGTDVAAIHDRQLIAALALADVVRTFSDTLEHIVLQTPDPAERLATLASVYEGGARAGLASLAVDAIGTVPGAEGVTTLCRVIELNAARARTVPASLAIAASTGAHWFAALVAAFECRSALDAQRLRHQVTNERYGLMERVDAMVSTWLREHRAGVGIERTMPLLRTQPERPPGLAIFPLHYRSNVAHAVG